MTIDEIVLLIKKTYYEAERDGDERGSDHMHFFVMNFAEPLRLKDYIDKDDSCFGGNYEGAFRFIAKGYFRYAGYTEIAESIDLKKEKPIGTLRDEHLEMRIRIYELIGLFDELMTDEDNGYQKTVKNLLLDAYYRIEFCEDVEKYNDNIANELYGIEYILEHTGFMYEHVICQYITYRLNQIEGMDVYKEE